MTDDVGEPHGNAPVEAWLLRRHAAAARPAEPPRRRFGPLIKHGPRGAMSLNWRHPLALPMLVVQLAAMPFLAVMQLADWLVRFRAGRAERAAIRRHLAETKR